MMYELKRELMLFKTIIASFQLPLYETILRNGAEDDQCLPSARWLGKTP
jgi:hypothetical protein